jgi:hypothetical protein
MENKYRLVGKIATEPEKLDNKNAYTFIVNTKRLSETYDKIPVRISSKTYNRIQEILDKENIKNWKENRVSISGILESERIIDKEGKSHLSIYVYALTVCTEYNKKEGIDLDTDRNYIAVEGILRKKSEERITPKGRKIKDFYMSVYDTLMTEYYIPCICWYKSIATLDTLKNGSTLKLEGRLQSRDYTTSTDSTVKTALELCATSLEETVNNLIPNS